MQSHRLHFHNVPMEASTQSTQPMDSDLRDHVEAVVLGVDLPLRLRPFDLLPPFLDQPQSSVNCLVGGSASNQRNHGLINESTWNG